MIAKKLINEVRKFRGPIYIETNNFNDVFHVQAVKSDLIAMIADSFDPEFETGFILDVVDGNGYLGKDHLNGN